MLYEGVSARPTTISLAEIRESVSGQPMSAAGQTQKSGSATGKSALPPRADIPANGAASRQKRSFVVFGLETDLLARCESKNRPWHTKQTQGSSLGLGYRVQLADQHAHVLAVVDRHDNEMHAAFGQSSSSMVGKSEALPPREPFAPYDFA